MIKCKLQTQNHLRIQIPLRPQYANSNSLQIHSKFNGACFIWQRWALIVRQAARAFEKRTNAENAKNTNSATNAAKTWKHKGRKKPKTPKKATSAEHAEEGRRGRNRHKRRTHTTKCHRPQTPKKPQRRKRPPTPKTSKPEKAENAEKAAKGETAERRRQPRERRKGRRRRKRRKHRSRKRGKRRKRRKRPPTRNCKWLGGTGNGFGGPDILMVSFWSDVTDSDIQLLMMFYYSYIISSTFAPPHPKQQHLPGATTGAPCGFGACRQVFGWLMSWWLPQIVPSK